MNKRKSIVWLVVAAVVIVLAAAFGFAPRFAIGKADDFCSALNLIELSSDFKAGAEYVIYTANEYYTDVYGNYTDKEGNVVDEDDKVAIDAEDLNKSLEKAAEIMKKRLELLSAKDIKVTVLDGKAIRVECVQANSSTSSTIFKSFVSNRGVVTVKVLDTEPKDGVDYSAYEDVLSVDKFEFAQAGSDSQRTYGIYFAFKGDGAVLISKATADASSSKTLYVTLLLDGNLIGYTSVTSPVQSNSTYFAITGISSYDKATQVALDMQTGSFDADFAKEHLVIRDLGAVMGEDAASKLFLVLAIIFAVAVVVMIVLYGLNGLAAALSLLLFATLTVFMVAFIPASTFGFESFIGAVVGLMFGIAAQFILLENVARQYNKLGRSRLDAIKDGSKKAFRINLGASVAAVFAAVFTAILLPELVGFAMTVLYSVIASALCSMAVSRGMLMLVRSASDNDKAYGYKRQQN